MSTHSKAWLALENGVVMEGLAAGAAPFGAFVSH